VETLGPAPWKLARHAETFVEFPRLQRAASSYYGGHQIGDAVVDGEMELACLGLPSRGTSAAARSPPSAISCRRHRPASAVRMVDSNMSHFGPRWIRRETAVT
jgi:hypothetical protein